MMARPIETTVALGSLSVAIAGALLLAIATWLRRADQEIRQASIDRVVARADLTRYGTCVLTYQRETK